MYDFTENKLDWLWQLGDGRYYSTRENDFVTPEFAEAWLERSGMSAVPASPVDEAGAHSETGLREALVFYGLPLGALLPPPTLEAARAAALEALRLKKWERKDAGITVNGVAIDTDDKGQATINGAVTNVLINPEFTTNWKTSAVDAAGASVWMTLDKPMILALSQALTAYTEACFAVEAGKQAELAGLASAAEIESWLENELAEGWPGQVIELG